MLTEGYKRGNLVYAHFPGKVGANKRKQSNSSMTASKLLTIATNILKFFKKFPHDFLDQRLLAVKKCKSSSHQFL